MINLLLFLLVGIILIEKLFSQRFYLKKYLKIYFLFKIFFSFIYFYFGFIEKTGVTFQIFEFGDSHTYHEFGNDLKVYWLYGDLFTVPSEFFLKLEQIGFGYIVGLIYYFIGDNPLNVIGVLNLSIVFLFFLIYKLSTELSYTVNQIDKGIILLSLSPMLFSISSVMYKDIFIAVFFLASLFSINQFFKKGLKLIPIFYSILFILILSSLRISFVWLLICYMLLKLLTNASNKINNTLFKKITIASIIFIFVIYYFFNNSNVALSMINTMQQAEGQGGKFMSGSMGMINSSNFFYAIPLKIIYVLLIPFPWVQSQESKIGYLEQFLYIFDSVYLITILFYLKYNSGIKMKSVKNYFFLIAGILLQISFMYFPSRRYLFIIEPILILLLIPILPNFKFIFKKYLFFFFLMLIVNMIYSLLSLK